MAGADLALIGAAGALGAAGAVHCAAMCAAPCAALCGPGARQQAAFLATRLIGYAAAGAAVAAAAGPLAWLAREAPALQPLRVLLHAAMLALGLWMLASGRMPVLAARVTAPAAAGRGDWRPMTARASAPWRGAAAGALWFAWPCALLHAALVLAALTGEPAAGASAMALFALASAPGLWLAPWAWRRALRVAGWHRLAGGLLALASVWALAHAATERLLAACTVA
jgi:uncharacterized protein